MKRLIVDMWCVICQEWRAIWRDEGVALITVFALFIYGISYSLGYGGEVLTEVPIAVVDESRSGSSRELIQMVDASPKVSVAYELSDVGRVEALLAERRIYGAVVVAASFEQDILSGRQAKVAILGDASYFLAYREVVEGCVAAIQSKNEQIVAERVGAHNPLVIYEQRNLFNPSFGYGIFVMPAIILLIVQQTSLMGIGMLSATRRERGVRYASSSAFIITLGRLLAEFATYALTLGFMLTVHYWLFDYPMRATWWRCAAVVVPYLLAVLLLAQALGALFRRRESPVLWLLWLSIPFLLVSGVSLPPQAFPQWLYLLGKVVPSSSAVEAWIAIQSRGASLADVAQQVATLWGLVIAYGAGAIVANRTICR